MDRVLEVQDLSVEYTTFRGKLRALEGVSFSLEKSGSLGLVGESGSGKTTLAKAILRVLPRNARVVSGSIVVEGKDVLRMSKEELNRSLRWKVISYVPQASQNSLDPLFTVGFQFVETVQAHTRMDEKEILEIAANLLEQMGVEKGKLNAYPWQLSGGQKQAVMLALALILRPKILVLDEPTTALDTLIQAQILDILRKLKEYEELATIFISHDIAVIAKVSTRVGVMYAGRLVELGGVNEVFRRPLHPYTVGLLRAVPDMGGRVVRPIGGTPPSPYSPPPGCPFHPRCPIMRQVCTKTTPQLEEHGGDHYAACHMAGELTLEAV